jgi:hypothetical protein
VKLTKLPVVVSELQFFGVKPVQQIARIVFWLKTVLSSAYHQQIEPENHGSF